MCNAYSLTLPRSAIVDFAHQFSLELDASAIPSDWRPRFRISPRQHAPILLIGPDGKLCLAAALWGFLTPGGKPGFAPTNARADKLVAGWPWKMVSKTQRCLIPADGFFEPEKPAGDKAIVPWSYYAMGNRQLFWMGGLFNVGPHPKTGEGVLSFTVVTTDACAAIRVHNRMPVIVKDDDALAWMSPSDIPLNLTQSFSHSAITGWRVSDDARNSRLPDHDGMIAPSAQKSLFD